MARRDRLVAGEAVSAGSNGVYRRVGIGSSDPLAVRVVGNGTATSAGRRLVRIGHVTDLQLADVQSPGRFEFLESLRGVPNSHSFVPAFRPQESLAPFAFSALLTRMGECEPDVVVSTGDNIDNAQWNELTAYLALFGGGEVALGGSRYVGVQAGSWPGDLFWRPDGGGDRWRLGYGYPTHQGLLERALRPFTPPACRLSWLSCFGNHDGLPFGEAIPTPAYRSVVCSGHKAYALPDGLDPFSHEREIYEEPERFLAGPRIDVPADESRRIVGRREFVAAHLAAPGSPAGHGYSPADLEAGRTYFTYDVTPGVRLICLDTANLDGASRGSIGIRQLDWLEERLAECHSVVLDGKGRAGRCGGEDRLVILASHHGPSSFDNLRRLERGLEDDQPRLGADTVTSLIARHRNVVLWLNGHRHVNEIVVHERHDRGDPTSAWMEISTASVADWPSQGRVVDVALLGDGAISISTEMLEHSPVLVPPPTPAGDFEPDELAALHRELAANVPGAGFGSALEGRPADRSFVIRMPAPFPLG